MMMMTQAQLDNGADMLRLKLALAQLYLYQEHIYKACDVLWSLGDLTFSPGVVCFISVLSLCLPCLLLTEIRCSVKMFVFCLCVLYAMFSSSFQFTLLDITVTSPCGAASASCVL